MPNLVHKLASLVTVAALAAATGGQAASPRLTADPERRAFEKSGWTFVGMGDGTLIYMKDAVPGAGSGGVRRVMTAYETLAPRDREGFSFRSVQSLGEFDCAQGRTRTVQETFYEEPSLKGRAVAAPEVTEVNWTQAVEGSVGLMRVAFACRERPIA